jgi:Tfp pilus assembly protein PilF
MKKVFLAIAVVSAAVLPSGRTLAATSKNTAEADLAHNSGRNYLADGRADLALEQFKKAVELDDGNYFAYKGMGLAYAQLKNYKEAEKAQRKSLEINPDFADVRNDLAATLMLEGRKDEARKEWEAATKSPFNPTPDQTAANLGNSYLEEKNYTEATLWFRDSLRRNEFYPRGHVGLAAALVGLGKADEALYGLEKVVNKWPADKGPIDLQMLYTLGDLYYKAGRFAEARTKLEAVLKLDPVGVWGRRAGEQLKQFPK